MLEGFSWIFFLTLALIGASVIDDFRSRKVHNSLNVTIFIVALIGSFIHLGFSGSTQILVSIFAAISFCLPLYLMRALGGGDFKLLLALSPLMSWPAVGWTLVFSLVWGTVLGLMIVIVKGEMLSFLRNLTSLALRNPVAKENLHKMPYTVAILLGFLTQVTLVERGVSLL